MDPVQRFLALDAAGGVLLMVATALALAWANSPWRDSYHAVWHTPAGVRVGDLAFEQSLHFWVNDGLMTIFFFVVGLEIRRELHDGELSDLRRALLPVVAAVGGMLVPAAVYAALNPTGPAADGWGVPMATDIAFSMGVLALLGARVPAALRVLLLALAVIDDIGAILVIAVFYSGSITAWGFGLAGLGLMAILAMQRAGLRSWPLYVAPAVVVWAGLLVSGVHPTLAGVLIGLITPVRAWFGTDGFVAAADTHLAEVRQGADPAAPLASLARAQREAVSPVNALLGSLHGWVSYVIMPVFALANAGVSLGSTGGGEIRVLVGVALGLVVGKPLGVLGATALARRLGWVSLPAGVGWAALSVVGIVAGIGFTMSLFIAQLAFGDGAALETAKLGILIASAAAALLAIGVARLALPR